MQHFKVHSSMFKTQLACYVIDNYRMEKQENVYVISCTFTRQFAKFTYLAGRGGEGGRVTEALCN